VCLLVTSSPSASTTEFKLPGGKAVLLLETSAELTVVAQQIFMECSGARQVISEPLPSFWALDMSLNLSFLGVCLAVRARED
jgi:hypothetical protein